MLNIHDEKGLVEQCRKQNRNAQKILYEKYYHKMMAICVRYLKSEEDALEVLNNAFLKAFAKIKQYKSEGTLEGWMKRIVINSSIDFVRSNKEYKNKFILTNEFSLYGSLEEEEPSSSSFSNIDSHLNKEQLFELITELPPATRIVFNLYVIDDFTHKQISEQLKISEGTSKWHLSNARKILQAKINQTVIKIIKDSDHGKETSGLR